MEIDGDELDGLIDAVRYNDPIEEIRELVLSGQYPINFKDISGKTALHAAAANGSVEIINLLASNGADLNAKNEHGSTPLHWAALNGHLDAGRHIF